MPLNKLTLKNKLIQIFSQPDTDSNVEQVAEQIADAIDEYVKEAKIVYTNGLTAPNGPVTGTFNGNLQ
ncbi:hypothetical protein [Flavobacterium sasangense]|uniref:hypothetical protein n=1 Tax=Flavobacterium sasangense TaxID=503361 RepID=UPI00047C7E7B|nr:hypothetical protein [Flavobacterium sasangense]